LFLYSAIYKPNKIKALLIITFIFFLKKNTEIKYFRELRAIKFPNFETSSEGMNMGGNQKNN